MVQSNLVNFKYSRLEVLFQIISCSNYSWVDINMYITVLGENICYCRQLLK